MLPPRAASLDVAGGSGSVRPVMILGLVLLILGWLLGIHILVTIGIVLLVIGLVLFVVGATGHALGGRRYWF